MFIKSFRYISSEIPLRRVCSRFTTNHKFSIMRNLHVFKELLHFLSKTHTKCLGCRTGHRLGVGTQTFAILTQKCARIACIGGCRSKSEMPYLKMFTDAVLAAHWDLRAHTLPCWGLFAPPNMFVHLTSWEYNGGGIFALPEFEIWRIERFRHIVGRSQQKRFKIGSVEFPHWACVLFCNQNILCVFY